MALLFRRKLHWATLIVAAMTGITFLIPFGSSEAAAATKPAMKQPVAIIDALSTSAYGTVLVVGGKGELAGAPLYMISSDTPTSYGCGTKVEDTYQGPITCTGPESDVWNNVESDEWPAFQTNDQVPEAGPGVKKDKIGLVYRPGIGWQVTYNHHPLYLFDPPSNPFVPLGENFLETVKPLPPWHGLWDLVSTSGEAAAGQATIETEKVDGMTVVAAEEYTNAVKGGAAITAYAFGSSGGNECTACSPTWIPVLTTGAPAATGGANASELGTIEVPGVGTQVTYDGDPLYLYSAEQAKFSHGNPLTTGTKGNGNGVTDEGGTFSLVMP